MAKKNSNQSNTTEDRTNDKATRANTGARRGKRNNPRSSRRDDFKEKAHLNNTGRDNDPNWYFTSSELANQAAELSFQSMMGTGSYWKGYKIPSIAVIKMNPCPGTSYSVLDTHDPTQASWNVNGFDNNNGINLMAQKIYTLLSTFTGRTSNYAPQDIATMLLAVAEVASVSEDIRRAFGLALTYNPRNRVLPKTMLYALGYNADELFSHIADYRMQFNIQMTRINQIPLLDNIGYIRKAREMYQRIYVDSPSSMAQMFAYVPGQTWVLDEKTDPDGTILTPVYWNEPAGLAQPKWVSMARKLEILSDMIDQLLNSSTLNIIYSDILNAATKINVPTWQFDYLAENYVVVPEYNRTALLQFHNLDIVGWPIVFASGNKYKNTVVGCTFTSSNYVFHDPDTNTVIYNPLFDRLTKTADLNNSIMYNGTFVDMDTDTPTLEDRIEALRFGVTRSGYNILGTTVFGPNRYDVFLSLPDHYCVEIDFFRNSADDVLPMTCNIVDDNNTMVPYYSDILSKFTNAPLLYVSDSGTAIDELESIVGDINFFTTVDYPYLARLNRLMYTGLWDFRV